MATELWTNDILDRLRELGDPPADELTAHFGSQMPGLVYRLVHSLGENDAPLPPGLPQPMRAFLDEHCALPAWADQAKIERGQRLFSRYGPHMVLALVCAALPECYAAARGAQILGLSQRMRRYTHRRVLETAQLVLDVMAPGGLGPGGRGVRSAQKVRLIHSVQRAILARQKDYRVEWGLPVNQEDMLGTLMAFSSVVLESLPRLGIDPDEEQAEGYLHAWLVVGHLLGCDSAFFPENVDEARQFAELVRRRQHAPTLAGREMARALVDLLEQAVPGTFLDGFISVLIRHLVGPRVAEILAIHEEDWTRALLWPLRLTNAVVDAFTQVPPIGYATELLSRKFLEGVYVVEQGAEPAQFYVPPQLSADWGLKPPPRPAVAPLGPVRDAYSR